MIDLARRALEQWDLGSAHVETFAHRENTIFKVAENGQVFAMRAHRVGYRSTDQLVAELDWMAAVATSGISVPAPARSVNQCFVEVVEDVQFDLLEWLPGITLSDAMQSNPARRIDLMSALGRATARFHIACDNWVPPPTFTRPHWDSGGLVGEVPVWGRFWEGPGLTGEDEEAFSAFRKAAARDLVELQPDYGLIHADLLGENVLVDGDVVRLIDFDDGGYGFRLFELTTALIRHLDAPDYPDLKRALFDGYRSVRALADSAFSLMLALRAATYVGWIADRTDLPDFDNRVATNAKLARRLIAQYLEQT